VVLIGDKTVKTVKVSEDAASDWEDYVDENPEVDSVSHLIRLAVQKEISGEYDLEQRVEVSQSNENDAANGEVLTRLRKLQTGISDIEERMQLSKTPKTPNPGTTSRRLSSSFCRLRRKTKAPAKKSGSGRTIKSKSTQRQPKTWQLELKPTPKT